MQRQIVSLGIILWLWHVSAAPAAADVTNIHSDLELETLLSKRRNALLYFTVEDCTPCRKASVVISKYASGTDEVPVLAIDLESTEIGGRYGAMVAPALVVLVDGKPVGAPFYITSATELEAKLTDLRAAFASAL